MKRGVTSERRRFMLEEDNDVGFKKVSQSFEDSSRGIGQSKLAEEKRDVSKAKDVKVVSSR